MAEKKVIELEVNTNLDFTITALKKAQREVAILSEKFGATSVQAVEAAKKAAILKDKIGDAKSLTDAFNPDAKFKSLTGALTGVAGGFSVVTGALGAFGKQNEDVEKALLKVQSAMALASGAQAIGESIDSFKQLGAVIKANAVFQKILTAAQYVYNLAMSLNPIGAIVTATVALIAAGYALINMFQKSAAVNDSAAKATKKNRDELKKQETANERVSEALKTKNGHELNMAKASGASAEAIRKLALKHADEEIALEKASLATARNTYEKEKNTLANYKNAGVSDEIIEKQRELVVESRKNVQEETKDLKDAYKSRQDIAKANQVERKQEQTDAKKDAIDSQKTINDKLAADNEKAGQDAINQKKLFDDAVIAYNQAIEDERVGRLATDREKEEAQVNAKYVKLKEMAVKAGVDTKALTDQQAIDLTALKDKHDKIAKDKQDEIDKTKAEKALSEKIKLESLTLNETDLKLAKLANDYAAEQILFKDNAEILLALKKKYEADVLEIETTSAEKSQADKQAVTDKAIQMTMTGLSIINDLFQMNASKSEKDARKAFKVNKAFNLATALTNTYLAVTAALANKKELFPGQRFIEAGLAGAAGAVQVAKISKTQFESGTTPDTSVPPPPSASMSAPQFNVVGNSGVNQLASLQNQPIQAYVVSGQVTTQQSLDRNRKENATL